MITPGALLTGLAIALPLAAEARSTSVRTEFQRQYPCPSTGQPKGSCPGWEMDHIVPLCRGGADTVANMHWLTIEQHRLKTRGDCRVLPGT